MIVIIILLIIFLYHAVDPKFKFGVKVKHITRGNGEKYMTRYTIYTCRFFSVKIHRIFESDDDCLHDHPWAFISFILKGGYVEHYIDYGKLAENYNVYHQEGSSLLLVDKLDFGSECINICNKRDQKTKIIHPFSVLYRPCNWIHKLEIHQPATSLVITFKKVRLWGFWTPQGFKPHYEYEGGQCDS